jgi:hypothetical protein
MDLARRCRCPWSAQLAAPAINPTESKGNPDGSEGYRRQAADYRPCRALGTRIAPNRAPPPIAAGKAVIGMKILGAERCAGGPTRRSSTRSRRTCSTRSRSVARARRSSTTSSSGFRRRACAPERGAPRSRTSARPERLAHVPGPRRVDSQQPTSQGGLPLISPRAPWLVRRRLPGARCARGPTPNAQSAVLSVGLSRELGVGSWELSIPANRGIRW